jgi:hypothetical protein
LWGYISFKRNYLPSYLTVTEGKNLSYGHEANVLVFPAEFFTTTLTHRFLAPCLGFTKKHEAVYAVPRLYEPLSEKRASRAQMCKWCEKVALGVEYLHSNGYSHGNLTPDKVLVGTDVKLIDYLDPYRHEKQPWQDHHVGKQSDAHDLGKLIWMCLHDNMDPPSKLPKPTADDPIKLYSLLRECWAPNGIDRPSLSDIIDTLSDTTQLWQSETGEVVFS